MNTHSTLFLPIVSVLGILRAIPSSALKIFPLMLIFVLSGCGSSSSTDDSAGGSTGSLKKFGIFTVQDDNATVKMNGVINSNSLNNFNLLLEKYPMVKHINIINCDGSIDDETNLQVSKVVYDKGISTHLSDNGLIASGGVDFFLAGIKRTRGVNTKIGVHSWSDGTNEASNFPVGHANHLPYINYYTSIGFTQQEAEDFYYFTINAASTHDIHYMSDAEIALYKVLKGSTTAGTGTSTTPSADITPPT